MNRTAILLLGSALSLALAGAAGAQEPAETEVSVQDQLAQLNSTMQEIVTLLKQQVQGQETSLLIKRVELSGRALMAKKERVQKAKSQLSNLEDEEASLAPMLEAMEKELSETTDDSAFSQLQTSQLEQRLKSIERKKRDLANELQTLENDVATEEEDMAVVEAVLDERLGLR